MAQDLIPYSCIVEDCDRPDEMYPTADDLLIHTLEKHSEPRWTCDYCAFGVRDENDTSKKALRIFDNAEDWKTHVISAHQDRVPAEQCDKLAQLNKRRMLGPLSCPLCEFVSETMDASIDDHILQHLHHFALRALPENRNEADDEGSRASQVSILLSHAQLIDNGTSNDSNYSNLTVRNIWDIIERVPEVLPMDKIRQDYSDVRSWLDHKHLTDEGSSEVRSASVRRFKETFEALEWMSELPWSPEFADMMDLAIEAFQDLGFSVSSDSFDRRPLGLHCKFSLHSLSLRVSLRGS